jgi:hypothetical protein
MRAAAEGRRHPSTENPMNRTRVILQTMITLAAASLGLVAALAWNEAIKALIKSILGEDDSLVGLFTYAILATVVAIVVLLILGRAAARVGGDAVINREAEG